MNTSENSLIYLPNNWYSSEKLDQENKNHDGMDLCLNGYLFKRQRINKNSINWLCKTSGCNASVTVTKEEKISRCIEHKIEIKHELVDEQEMLRIKFNNDCKIRAETEHLSVGKIYLEEQAKVAKTSNYSYETLSKIIVPFNSMKSTLTKRKRKTGPKLPKSLKDMVIPNEYQVNNQNEKYLIYNKDNKILVFSSPTQIKALSQATHWYADGTFRTAAKFFYQLYIIHAYINHHMIPCCFALMHRKSKTYYSHVFLALKKEAKILNLKLEPKYVMTDFEPAAILTFKNVFPGIENKGCLFHFCQALMKYINNKCSLKTEFQKNIEIQKWFRTICALALCPLDKSEHLFSNIMSTQPENPKLDKFMQYFVNNYYEGPIFECQMWNHFDTIGYPRTNNNLEGYNNKLSNHLAIAHPDIFKAISKFKEEETDASLKYYRANNEDEEDSQPTRRKLNVISDAILNNHREMLKNNEISIDTYSKYVALMFDINALSKKKKKVQDDGDDNDSDELSSASEIDSDDSELGEFIQ